MAYFYISPHEMRLDFLRAPLHLTEAGGYCSFEGWVRDHNEGRAVKGLEYEIYRELALKEGLLILEEAKARFEITQAVAMHREGALSLGEMAVWIGVSAPHRDGAFKACRYIIDEIKKRLPIWKKEHYSQGDAQWVACHHCAQHSIDDEKENRRL